MSHRVVLGLIALALFVALIGLKFAVPWLLPAPDPAVSPAIAGLNLGELLHGCKPAGAAYSDVPLSDPRTQDALQTDELVAKMPRPHKTVHARWVGPTDAGKLLAAITEALGRHMTGRGMRFREVSSHHTATPGRVFDTRVFRCDLPNGTCAATASIVLDIRGDECDATVAVVPTGKTPER